MRSHGKWGTRVGEEEDKSGTFQRPQAGYFNLAIRVLWSMHHILALPHLRQESEASTHLF
jgi:hypothetical protein